MKNAKSKKTFYLILILLTSALFFASLIVFSILGQKRSFFNDILIVVLIVFVIVIIFLQRKFNLYVFIDQHNRLFENLAPPFTSNIKLTDNTWERKLKDEEYELYNEADSVAVYFAIKKISQSQKNNTLYLVIHIKDERISFENDDLSLLIANIEQELFKKHRYRHRIYLQFKEYPHETDELKESTHDVIWSKHGKRSVTLLNVINFTEDNKLFFVYNKEFLPTTYYKLAVQEVFNLANLPDPFEK